jgi:mono/diheme cytochrome c family protein
VPFLHVQPSGGSGPLAWAVLVAGLALAAYGLRAGLGTPEGRAFLVSGVLAAALSGAGLLRAWAVPAQPAQLRNPFLPTAESVATGRRLYEGFCAACHGVHGAGDGPAAAGVFPRPVDLRVHVPMHTDGQLYLWITEGLAGTAMPAFRDRLTEEERWHVVNYLRVLALGAR